MRAFFSPADRILPDAAVQTRGLAVSRLFSTFLDGSSSEYDAVDPTRYYLQCIGLYINAFLIMALERFRQ